MGGGSPSGVQESGDGKLPRAWGPDVIAKVSGTLAHKTAGEIIVDVGGVGYHLFTSLRVFYRLPQVGERVSLHVHTHVREDALQLFGFLDYQEKQVFLLLNGVVGIGPKLAVSILSGIPAEELVRALGEGNEVRLVSVPGVGKRLAERMIVELRDKLAVMDGELSRDEDDPGSQVTRDAISALVNLGYRRAESDRAVRDTLKGGAKNLEEVLKRAFQRLGR